jgi:peroxiredoxin
MTHLKSGDRAPDFALTTVEGAPVTLGDYRGQPLLLVFLRHLG